MTKADVDVLVVGGGPVGLVAAIEARTAGMTVAVLEPRLGAIDKACGEGLMPGAVAALSRLAIFPRGHVIAGVSYQDSEHQADHLFRHCLGMGVRRTTLHGAIAARADELGVERLSVRVDSLQQDDSGVTAAGIRASWLLGCDGLHSKVRRLVGLQSMTSAPGLRRFGSRQHFLLPPWTDLVEVHWSPSVEAYVTPVAEGLVGVAVLGPQRVDFRRAIADIPRLAERLGDAVAEAPVRAAGPLRQHTSRRTAGRVLLVGDASGYVDALTGEGIRVGLAQAAAAVAAIRSGNPQQYERAWLRATRDFRLLTSGLVGLATSRIRGGIVPGAAALPRTFGNIVERLAR